MTDNERSRLANRPLLLIMLVLLFASTASASWKEKVLYSFQGGTDGATPAATPAGGVVFDQQGNLYGATTDGGATNCSPVAYCGTVYQLSPQPHGSWKETVLYVFKGKVSNDGELPAGGVITDASGNIYGTTAYGGTGGCVLTGVLGGCGTVYELSPPKTKGGKWTYKILYSFKGGKDGYLPTGDLVFDASGNLYGATDYGGGKGTTCDPVYQFCGTVFELSPPKTKGGQWTEKVLHSFAGGTDGANPNGGLILDGKGVIYGTTAAGGDEGEQCGSGGCGTVFELKPPTKKGGAWVETVLYRFKSTPDGTTLGAGVIFDKSGKLNGATVDGGGGNFGSGTIFRLAPHSNGKWTEKVLYSFQDNGDGGQPRSGLVFDSKGTLYGTAASGGGSNFAGTVFQLAKDSAGRWVFAAVYSFNGVNNGDGAFPSGEIVLSAGKIFGTTEVGGTGSSCQGGCGTVFEVRP